MCSLDEGVLLAHYALHILVLTELSRGYQPFSKFQSQAEVSNRLPSRGSNQLQWLHSMRKLRTRLHQSRLQLLLHLVDAQESGPDSRIQLTARRVSPGLDSLLRLQLRIRLQRKLQQVRRLKRKKLLLSLHFRDLPGLALERHLRLLLLLLQWIRELLNNRVSLSEGTLLIHLSVVSQQKTRGPHMLRLSETSFELTWKILRTFDAIFLSSSCPSIWGAYL